MRKFAWTLALSVLLAVGCGQPKRKVALDANLPPVDFSIRPPAENLQFSVEGSQVVEVMGTSMEQFFRYQWRAGSWRDEKDGSRTADLRFSKVQATERSGQAATPEPMTGFDRLEGFHTRYRLDAEGFKPVAEPARDQEFMQAFSVLSQGLTALDFERPDAPVAPGGSWTVPMDMGDLGPMGAAIEDSIIRLRYTGNTRYKGRDCARVEVSMTSPIDGDIQKGPAHSHVTGSLDASVRALFDLQKHFYVQVSQKSTMRIQGQDFDAKGKALGGKKNLAQNSNFEISYLGR